MPLASLVLAPNTGDARKDNARRTARAALTRVDVLLDALSDAVSDALAVLDPSKDDASALVMPEARIALLLRDAKRAPVYTAYADHVTKRVREAQGRIREAVKPLR